MSTEEVAAVEVAPEISTEPVSTEIGSGEVEVEVKAEANLGDVVDEQVAADMEQLAEDVEDAIGEGATPEDVQEMIETFKLKVNGKDKEVTLDWNNKEDIIRRLQMAEAAPEAMQKSATLEKTYASEIQRLQSNPWEVLQELGLDPLELAEARIESEIQQMQKSPEQVLQEERDAELEALREKLRKQDEEKKDNEYKILQQQADVDLENEITEAISGTSELPKSPYVMKRVADAMLWAMDHGYKDVKPKDVISTVEKEINTELQTFLDAMPDKVLEKYLGNKTIDRLRKKRLSNMPKSVSNLKDTGTAVVEENDVVKKQSMRDFLKNGIK